MHTWLVIKKLDLNNLLNLFYFCNFIKYKNYIYNNNLNKLEFILNIICKQHINKFPTYFNKTKFNNLITKNSLSCNSHIVQPYQFIPFNSSKVLHFNKFSFLKNLIQIFFTVSYVDTNIRNKPHAFFRLFFLRTLNSREFVFHPTSFFQKWTSIYNFIFNSFYFNFLPLIFSSKFFKKEVLSINWFFHSLNLSSWRYTSFFFTFYNAIYSQKLFSFYKNLKHRFLSYAFVSDLEYHFRTFFYLKRNKWFILALVPINLNPWMVSFAIPVGQSNFFSQFFFFKFLLLIRKKSALSLFQLKKKNWFYINNILSLQKWKQIYN